MKKPTDAHTKESVKEWFVHEDFDELVAMIPAARQGGFEKAITDLLEERAKRIIENHFGSVSVSFLSRIEEAVDILVPINFIADLEKGEKPRSSLWKYVGEKDYDILEENEFIQCGQYQHILTPISNADLKYHNFYSRRTLYLFNSRLPDQ